MQNELKLIKNVAENELENISTLFELENFRIKFFGKNGKLTLILKKISSYEESERPQLGKVANLIKADIRKKIEEHKIELEKKEIDKKMLSEKIDITIPGKRKLIASKHPLTIILDEIKNIFLNMNFSVEEGPEIEYTEYNFDFLNTPKNHPSRDLTDTFYIDKNILLRTQTSPVQVRTMLSQKPPIKMISPGRVFRRDEVDASHSPVFHQVEGLVIDKGITMANLKYTMEIILKKIYGENIKIRFRPHYFPFTEPSAEVDITCFKCGGIGCRFCKDEGWIEILGAGMVHPNVLKNCKIDYNVYSGFAFGLGLERIVMFRYGIDDIRLFYENDIKFLEQFK
ncbi:MAG: phenylalanine--tRNA ligase subunit alpha [Clostridiales bacterium]|jgi:phenylalanyl-tRNA synthetase alpha chain|nr:phenylalanine--tRNA ligase subunit alpha [Clostridiales bacterium]